MNVSEEYDVVEIPGKHGIIHLHVPKKEPTQDDKEELYKAVAEVALNIHKREKTADNK